MTKRKNRATIQRAQAMPAPNGGIILSPQIIQQALAQMKMNAKGNNTTDLFSPGQPMDPQQGTNPQGWPRSWSYPLAQNTFSNDRTLQKQDIPSFEQLRKLADLYEGIQLCEKVWLDMIPRLKLKIQLKPALAEAGKDEKKYQSAIDTITQFFETPGGPGTVDDFHTWLKNVITDQLQIDAIYLYKRRDKSGKLIGLPAVDGSTMKPLIDDWGYVVAYQQFVWGVPGDIFLPKDLIYFRESPRTNTPYGKSRIERIMLRVNQALRKEQKDLAFFTEGNQPYSIMEVPEASNWTPDQIETFEMMWNGLIAGSQQQQVRMKFTQPGMKYQKLEEYQLLSDFDQFILNICTACYGISMADLSFTGSIHKSADDGQQNMLYRRTLDPIVGMYSMLITNNIIRDEFHQPDLEATFSGFDVEEDVHQMASAYSIMIQNAIVSPATAARALKQPDIEETGPLFITKSGITPLASFEIGSESRKASDAAQLAGLQLAANPPEPTPEEGDDETTGKPAAQSQQKAPVAQKTSTSTAKPNAKTPPANRDLSAEYRRWRQRAIDDVKAGKPLRAFSSELIPSSTHAALSEGLARCSTPDEVRTIFERAAKDTFYDDSAWQNTDETIQKQLQQYRADGVTHLQWEAYPDACDTCQENNGEIRKLGEPFTTGVMMPVQHPECTCRVKVIKGEQP